MCSHIVRRGRSVRRRGSVLFSALGPLIANYINIMSKLKRNSFDESKKGSIRSTVLNEGFKSPSCFRKVFFNSLIWLRVSSKRSESCV